MFKDVIPARTKAVIKPIKRMTSEYPRLFQNFISHLVIIKELYPFNLYLWYREPELNRHDRIRVNGF